MEDFKYLQAGNFERIWNEDFSELICHLASWMTNFSAKPEILSPTCYLKSHAKRT